MDSLSRERELTYDQLGDCTIGQIRRMAAHGKPDVSMGPAFAGSDPFAAAMRYDDFQRARRRDWINGRLAALGRPPLDEPGS